MLPAYHTAESDLNQEGGGEFWSRAKLEQAYTHATIKPGYCVIPNCDKDSHVGKNRTPRVTSLPSPAIAGPRPQPTLYRSPPAPFSFRQAQLLWRVPAWLLGTLSMLAHAWRVVKSSYVPGHKYRFSRNQHTPATRYQPGLLQIRHYVHGISSPVGLEESEHHAVEQVRLLFHQHVPCFGDGVKFG